MHARSVTDIAEHELAKWFFEFLIGPQPLLNRINIHLPAKIHYRTPISDLFEDVKDGGDIDVLFHSLDAPEDSVAIECKRVKIKADAFIKNNPNKIHGLSKGINQANYLYRLGFSRVYMIVFIVTDGRKRLEYNFAFRGASQELVDLVEYFPDFARLINTVGLVFIELSQPVDKDITFAGAIGTNIRRTALPREQSSDLTRRIIELSKGG